MSKWKPGKSAPKNIVSTDGYHKYGPYFLADTYEGVRRVRWWDASEGSERRFQNFLGDDGNAVARIFSWTELPKPPRRVD